MTKTCPICKKINDRFVEPDGSLNPNNVCERCDAWIVWDDDLNILGDELEAFRAAHDCEEEQWDVEWINDQAIYHCGACGKEMFCE